MCSSDLISEPPTPEIEGFTTPVDESELATARTKILENLSPSPVLVDELIRQSELPAPLVLTVLLELELAGRVQRLPGNRVALISG